MWLSLGVFILAGQGSLHNYISMYRSLAQHIGTYQYLTLQRLAKLVVQVKIRKSRMRGQNSEENQIMEQKGKGKARSTKMVGKKEKQKNSKRKKLHAINYKLYSVNVSLQSILTRINICSFIQTNFMQQAMFLVLHSSPAYQKWKRP